MDRITKILNLLPKRSRNLFYLFLFARSALSLLDLAGILIMGLLVAKTAQTITFEINFAPLAFLNTLSLFEITILVLTTFILKSIFSVLFAKIMSKELARAESIVATDLYQRILASDFNFISKYSKQNLIYGLGNSATSSIINLLTVFSTIVSEGFMLLVVLITFAFVDLNLTVFTFLYFSIIGFILNRFIGDLSHKAGRENAIYAVRANQVVEDSLSAFREIKTFNKESFFIKNFFNARKISSSAVSSASYISALPRFVVEPALMIGAILLAGFSLKSSGGLTTLGIFLTGGLRIMAAMLPLQMALSTFKNLTALAEKFIELNNDFSAKKSKVIEYRNKDLNLIKNDSGPIGIKISNLSFRYEDNSPLVLNNISLNIPAGSFAAIIGPSGSGKSTLADLIVGGISEKPGHIDFSDRNGNKVERDQIEIGYVPQEPGIISGTILENITLEPGNEKVDEALIEKALDLSHLTSVVNKLDFGIRSKVGEQMEDLSGGQFQRVGLARALYINPNLLVLDEATSALDMETENAIKDTLLSLKDNVTTIVIAHRLSTVKSADIVFILEDGRINDSGNFQDLVARNKLVARYVELSDLNSE